MRLADLLCLPLAAPLAALTLILESPLPRLDRAPTALPLLERLDQPKKPPPTPPPAALLEKALVLLLLLCDPVPAPAPLPVVGPAPAPERE